MPEVSKQLREAIVRRLSNASDGFNATFADLATKYGVQPLTIDWSERSKQFFTCSLGPGDLDESTPTKYPLAMLYSTGSDNARDRIPSVFSGSVDFTLEIHVTWKQSGVPNDLESLGDAVEDTLYEVFADGNWPQLFGARCFIQSAIRFSKAPVEKAAESWRQSLRLLLTFRGDAG